jgi:hypothetical protein
MECAGDRYEEMGMCDVCNQDLYQEHQKVQSLLMWKDVDYFLANFPTNSWQHCAISILIANVLTVKVLSCSLLSYDCRYLVELPL